jgi:Linear amide C-N hydrolases, choloylglycine hydrolase family
VSLPSCTFPSDATGDSAIFEYLCGKLVIHHGRQYTVMTNSPVYDEQLALNRYWQEIGGLVFCQGQIVPPIAMRGRLS